MLSRRFDLPARRDDGFVGICSTNAAATPPEYRGQVLSLRLEINGLTTTVPRARLTLLIKTSRKRHRACTALRCSSIHCGGRVRCKNQRAGKRATLAWYVAWPASLTPHGISLTTVTLFQQMPRRVAYLISYNLLEVLDIDYIRLPHGVQGLGASFDMALQFGVLFVLRGRSRPSGGISDVKTSIFVSQSKCRTPITVLCRTTELY